VSDPGVNILPAKSLDPARLSTIDSDDGSQPPIRMTPDKSEIVRLDGEAATVIIGNPAHLSILAENTQTLVLAPKPTGAAYFVVLDKAAKVIMQRLVFVSPPSEKYTRIRRSCTNSTAKNCQTTQVYYCPDICHEIMMTGDGGGSGSEAQQNAASAA